MNSLFVILSLSTLRCFVSSSAHRNEQDPKYWREISKNSVNRILRTEKNNNVAKNVILFLGDGMGISTVTAGRIYKGQKHGHSGEEGSLSFEDFADIAMLKTYAVDQQVTDSCASATAYLCGVKANRKTLGVDAKTKNSDCKSSKGSELDSIMMWSQQEGKSTGFVTTSRVTHCSPAGLYAHAAHRWWESDVEMPTDAASCKDIARQLVEDEPGRNAKVILGGGRRHFLPNSTVDVLSKEQNLRTDRRDLILEWTTDKIESGYKSKYVNNLRQFQSVDPADTDYLLGLFGHSHMNYELDRNKGSDGEPSLAEMTSKAIEILSKDKNGFFLFVEGARIDHAHHSNQAQYALEEMYQFDKAIEAALKATSTEDTLIVVTADHDQSMKISGYNKRGAPILGSSMSNSDVDDLPYTTLLYATGPGYVTSDDGTRANITGLDILHNKEYMYTSAIPMNESHHGGEDVPAYAIGPMSYLFKGVQEQSYVAYAMAYASCVGENKEHCEGKRMKYSSGANAGMMQLTYLTSAFHFLFYLQSTLYKCI
ncbi:ALPL (predicted) [Pycnogonum litorale]